jgi:hypothetical protein
MQRDLTFQENRLLQAIDRLNAATGALRDASLEIDRARKEYQEALASNLSSFVGIISKFVEQP